MKALVDYMKYGGLDLMSTLCLEASKRAIELHPDIPNPTADGITRAIGNMLERQDEDCTEG